MAKRLYMVIETFRDGNAKSIYQRFRERGRMAPPGLTYVSSWATDDLKRCYQIMETDERSLLDEWMSRWSDLIEFEVRAVITSEEAAKKAWRV